MYLRNLDGRDLWPRGGGGGGGGYFHMYAYWVCATRETPIFTPKFPFRSISFSQMTKKSGPEHHHFTFFAVPETIIFKISLISTRSPSPTAGSARTQSVRQRPGLAAGQSASQKMRISGTARTAVPEIRIFTLKTAQARSGAPQFHAQNGSSSFWSPAFSRSTVELVPEPGPIFHFAAAHTYQNLGWVPPPRAYDNDGCFNPNTQILYTWKFLNPKMK